MDDRTEQLNYRGVCGLCGRLAIIPAGMSPEAVLCLKCRIPLGVAPQSGEDARG